MSSPIHSVESLIEQRINHFARKAEASTAFEDWKSAMEKMLEWKKKRTPATVQRLEDERLAQVQASATIARGVDIPQELKGVEYECSDEWYF